MQSRLAAMDTTDEEAKRAEMLRDLLADEERKIRSGMRKRPRPIRVGLALSHRCDVPGIEGSLVGVSVTGALVTVRDRESRAVIDVPNAEILSMELH